MSPGKAVTFPKLIELALAGDSHATSALIETATFLGLGISNLMKGLSPEAVIVGGDIAQAWPLIVDELHQAISRNNICRGLPSTLPIPSTLGYDTRLIGALSLVLADKFSSIVPA